MYFEFEELAEDERQNGFFVVELKRLTGKVNDNLAQELRDRLGHYVRTELLQRFQRIEKSGSMKENRYSIPVPITDLEIALFQRNRTSTHIVAEDLYEVLLRNMGGTYSRFTTHLRNGTPSNPTGTYIQYSCFRKLVGEECGVTNSKEVKGLLKKLQEQKMLSSSDHRTSTEKLGFRILPRVNSDEDQGGDDDLFTPEDTSQGKGVTDD